jgi:multiple sugar transport system substrate-binding protein
MTSRYGIPEGRRLSRRTFIKGGIALGAAGATGSLLAACGDDDNGGSTSGGSGRGSGEVVIGSYLSGTTTVYQEKVLADFERDTGIRPVFLEDEYSTFFEKSFNDAQNQGGQYDVYLLDDPWIPQFGAARVLVNLSELGFASDDDSISAFSDQGYWPPPSGPRIAGFEDAEPQIYALPTIGDVQIYAYRRDVFGEAPATWDDLVAIARSLRARGDENAAYVLRGVAGNPIITSFDPVFQSFGGAWFDDQWNPTFGDATGQAAADFFVTTLKGISPANTAEYDTDQETAALLDSRAYSAVMYSGGIAEIQNSRVADKFGFAIVPRKEKSFGQVGFWMAALSPSAPNRDNAIAFLRWSLEPKQQVAMARAKMMPVTRSGFEDQQALDGNPVLPVWLEQLDVGAGARPRTPDWVRVEDTAGRLLNPALIKGSGGGAALEEAAADVTAYFDRQSYYDIS